MALNHELDAKSSVCHEVSAKLFRLDAGGVQVQAGEMQAPSNEVVFEGIHCTLTIRRPRPGLVLAIFKGPDVGEFGQAPFQELGKDLSSGKQIEMFVDARAVRQASLDVSNDWAQWMMANEKSLTRINMLCAAPFVQLTAKIVRSFTGFGERMRIYTDASAFETALGNAVADVSRIW